MCKPSQSPPELAQVVEKHRWTRSDTVHVVTAWRKQPEPRSLCHDLDPQRIARWAAEFPERPSFAEVVVVTDPKPSPSEAKAGALNQLLMQIKALESWFHANLTQEASAAPLQEQLALLGQRWPSR